MSTLTELSASQITESALSELNYRGFTVWRQNNLRVSHRTFTGKKGLPDIVGFCRTSGKALYAEVKKIGDTIKPDQVKFLYEAHNAGAVVMIATQVKNEVKVMHLSELVNYQEKHIQNITAQFNKTPSLK